MPHRYFASEFTESTAALTGPDAHHLGKVMRARPGDEVILCDGAGFDYTAAVAAVTPDRVEFRLLEKRPSEAEPSVEVTLFAGYPKQDKLEFIVQKAVELGAARIVPFFSRFCVAAPKKEDQKNARYARIAAEAAKQAGRGVIPAVELPLDIKDLPARFSEFDLVLFFYEGGGESLRTLVKNQKRIALITGAEGGFSPEEAEKLVAAGAVPVGLGPRILRCETAPVAGLAAVMTLAGQLE
ncbi:MAG TPA: 16S rRNA (uracil(1498)-N(3))-methyltransferase [Candidatus Fournierella merdipullorum]|uniref:Ribosomal RNA small subunit methyltransferase E n=1 Tax=Candidatus Allofournierella merdipullorum TaxID=2838595 RepID=A0A9D2E376_9FIRM|nr:16S rRNA (uracil(1498)-N(3))-methyltransferase [Candidatus Fournierella merdipullorum]